MTQTQADSYILFEVAGTTYGVRSQDVKHMEMVERITPVPNSPRFVEGAVFSRGEVIPAVNLRLRFGFPHEAHTTRSRLIVIDGGNRSVGLIVDAAREFRNLPPESIQPPNESIAGLSGKYLRGIAVSGERLILLLDVNEVITLVQNEESVPTLALNA